MHSKQVFFSYVKDTEPFVTEFHKYFFSDTGSEILIPRDVTAGQNERDELVTRIDRADVFVAFICDKYEEALTHEFQQLVSIRDAGRYPKIIPITLSQKGRNWWWEFKKKAKFDFEDEPFFTKAMPNWNPPDPRKVAAIREQALESTVTKSTSSPKRLIVLGHPQGELPKAIRLATDVLVAEVQQAGIASASWPDKWAKPSSRDLIQESTLFVQPVSVEDVPEHLGNPQSTAEYLLLAATKASKTILEKSQVMLWLPKGEQHGEFEKRAGERDAKPVFRSDDPSGLASDLIRELGRDWKGPILTLEGVEELGDEDAELRQKLPDEIYDCVERYLSEQKYYVELPPIEFEREFDEVAERRPILVAHDFTSSGRVKLGIDNPWQEIKKKFTNVQSRADKILHKKGLRETDVFWIACISNGIRAMPRSPHLPAHDLKRWKVLELAYEGGRVLAAEASRRSLDEALKKWAQKHG